MTAKKEIEKIRKTCKFHSEGIEKLKKFSPFFLDRIENLEKKLQGLGAKIRRVG